MRFFPHPDGADNKVPSFWSANRVYYTHVGLPRLHDRRISLLFRNLISLETQRRNFCTVPYSYRQMLHIPLTINSGWQVVAYLTRFILLTTFLQGPR